MALPRLLRQILTAASLAAVLLPAVAAQAAPSSDRQAEIERELRDARAGLEVLEERKTATLADVAVVDARRDALEAQLADLRTQLGTAQHALDHAEVDVQRTAAQLEQTQADLARARDDLAHQRDVFSQRVRATYKRGGLDLGSAVLGAEDLSDLGRSVRYLQAVLGSDRQRVVEIDGLQRQIERDARELAALREHQERARAAAAQERDRVAELVARQEDVTAQARAEARRHELLLAQIEADEDEYNALVDALEAESERLSDQLRRRAAEQDAARRAATDVSRRAAPLPSASAPDRLQLPAHGRRSSGFGYRTHPISGRRRLHAGIDIAAPSGTPIVAAADGVVVSAGRRGGYGNATVIDHGGGMATLYAHQSRFAARSGTRVRRGQLIGYIGSTGYSTGPHLHFEVRLRGRPVDPDRYL